MDVIATTTNIAIGRRVDPIEIEKACDGGIELGFMGGKPVIPTDNTF